MSPLNALMSENRQAGKKVFIDYSRIQTLLMILLCWLVKKGCKGHMEEKLHIELWQQPLSIVPDDKTIIFLGDGEFDGSNFLHNINKTKHLFVARTAENRKMIAQDDLFTMHDLDVGAEEFIWTPNAKPIANTLLSCNAVAWWNRDYKEPMYLFYQFTAH
jgi:hypothetical protein